MHFDIPGKQAEFSVCFIVAGSHQDHRQESAGRGKSTESLPRSANTQDAGPAKYHQALPGALYVYLYIRYILVSETTTKGGGGGLCNMVIVLKRKVSTGNCAEKMFI